MVKNLCASAALAAQGIDSNSTRLIESQRPQARHHVRHLTRLLSSTRDVRAYSFIK